MTEQTSVPTDEALMEAYARRGDDSAFEALVTRHAGWIMASAHRQLKDRQLAEDATQAVFVLLCRRCKKWRSGANVAGWLFLTTRYTVLAMRRDSALRQRHEKAAVEAKAMNADTTRMESRVELAECLDEAVARLPGRERSAVLLRFYRGLDFPAIAQAEGISQHAARKRVERAIDRLRRRLDGPGVTSAAIGAAALTGFLGSTGSTSGSAAAAYGSICRVALTARNGAALPPAIDAAAKGTLAIMALTHAKTAAVAAVVCIVIAAAVPLAISQLKFPTPIVASPAPPTVVLPTPPAPGSSITPQRLASQLQLAWTSVVVLTNPDPRFQEHGTSVQLNGRIKVLDDSNILGTSSSADLTDVLDESGHNLANPQDRQDSSIKYTSQGLYREPWYDVHQHLVDNPIPRAMNIGNLLNAGPGIKPARIRRIAGTYHVLVAGKTTIKDIPLVKDDAWQELAPDMHVRVAKISIILHPAGMGQSSGYYSVECRLEGKPGESSGNFSGIVEAGRQLPATVISRAALVDASGQVVKVGNGDFFSTNEVMSISYIRRIGKPVKICFYVASDIQTLSIPFDDAVDLEAPALAPAK